VNRNSIASHFLHHEGDDSNDHNDVWRDGALLFDLGVQTVVSRLLQHLEPSASKA
jgi:hypothetical protein